LNGGLFFPFILECSDMLELIASRLIRKDAEVLELYRVARKDNATECYRLVWADAVPVTGRKARLLDVRDFRGATRALAAFHKAK
jgi:hypothetical protein